jgi:hypothetical protein
MRHRCRQKHGQEVLSIRGAERKSLKMWCARQELNLRPAGSKPDALSN